MGQVHAAADRALERRLRRRVSSAARRRGFSFTEALFAVMILGIGGVMVAAIFPVAIRQTQSNFEDSKAASIARSAVNLLQASVDGAEVPAENGVLRPVRDASPELWHRVKGQLIAASDPRFAWTALIRRDDNATTAQVFLFILRSRNRPVYDPRTDLEHFPDANDDTNPATLEPRLVSVEVTSGSPGLVRFRGEEEQFSAAAEGSYVVICNDQETGAANGSIYRLGNESDAASNTWQIASPGIVPENLTSATAALVGRAYANPADPSRGYEGLAQDVAVYTSFIKVN